MPTVMEQENHTTSFFRLYILPALLLFAVPAIALGFSHFAKNKLDRDFRESVQSSIKESLDQDPDLSEADKLAFADLYSHAPEASEICAGDTKLAPEFAELANAADCSSFMQCRYVRIAALASIALGIASWLVALVCALLAYRSRKIQYPSFVAGWWILRIASTLQLILQGALLVWLSVWIFALWADKFSVKLTLAAGFFAFSAVAIATKAIFAQPDLESSADGILLERQNSPAIWNRIQELCRQLETEPPENIILGIDENFYVTQSDVLVSEKLVTGRSLYVSLSLLRVLSCEEADAVLAHEMAHFSGGDTASSQRLRPKLLSFELYLEATRMAYPVFAFMRAYYVMFIHALRKDDREREFRADATAAKLVSSTAVAHSLIKVCGYASYRERIHDTLLGSDRVHDELAIPERLRQGIEGYAHSNFKEDIATMHIPHPFDSHPPLIERIHAVGLSIEEANYPQILLNESDSWYSQIEGAQAMERSLWDEFQTHFASVHEMVLAHRYLPANEEEARIVLAHFPPLQFPVKNAQPPLELSYEDLRWHKWPAPVKLSNIKELQWIEQTFIDDVMIKLVEPIEGKKKLKLSCKSLLDKEDFQEALQRYLDRHLEAQEYQASHAPSEAHRS